LAALCSLCPDQLDDCLPGEFISSPADRLAILQSIGTLWQKVCATPNGIAGTRVRSVMQESFAQLDEAGFKEIWKVVVGGEWRFAADAVGDEPGTFLASRRLEFEVRLLGDSHRLGVVLLHPLLLPCEQPAQATVAVLPRATLIWAESGPAGSRSVPSAALTRKTIDRKVWRQVEAVIRPPIVWSTDRVGAVPPSGPPLCCPRISADSRIVLRMDANQPPFHPQGLPFESVATRWEWKPAALSKWFDELTASHHPGPAETRCDSWWTVLLSRDQAHIVHSAPTELTCRTTVGIRALVRALERRFERCLRDRIGFDIPAAIRKLKGRFELGNELALGWRRWVRRQVRALLGTTNPRVCRLGRFPGARHRRSMIDGLRNMAVQLAAVPPLVDACGVLLSKTDARPVRIALNDLLTDAALPQAQANDSLREFWRVGSQMTRIDEAIFFAGIWNLDCGVRSRLEPCLMRGFGWEARPALTQEARTFLHPKSPVIFPHHS
jgi:hypothetical protein